MERLNSQPGSKKKKDRIFPADELGIPLAIYIPAKYRTADGRLDREKYPVDRHHRFAPRKRLIHKEGDMGKLLRYSCLQIVPKELHEGFNGHYLKPELPESRPAKFGAILLSIARYLPAEAIDVSGESPERREIPLEERHRIWANNELRPEQGTKLQNEILDYVASRRITGIDTSLIENFVTTPDDGERLKLGRQLFRIASEVAVEPVEQAYVDAWESALLPRQHIEPEAKVFDITYARAVPKKPASFIVRHVVKDEYAFDRALDKLEDSLIEQYPDLLVA